MKKISVVYADDHPLVRDGIRNTLLKVNDIELVGEATDSAAAQRLCDFYQPTVLLLDINMPGPTVSQTVKEVQENCPQTKILILTAHDDATNVRTLVDAGVAGYMLKDEATQKVVEAIRAVAEGRTWFSQRVMSTLLQPQIQKPDPTPKITLTEREHEVLQLMIAGKSDKEIGQTLHISARTVSNYLRRVYDKLRVNTRVQAAVRAVRLGLVD